VAKSPFQPPFYRTGLILLLGSESWKSGGDGSLPRIIAADAFGQGNKQIDPLLGPPS
jgi:hypothetical protein